MPSFVGSNTFVIACSYSGNTEETLAATRDAIDRGAKVLAVTSGGELAELVQRRGFPLIKIPGGQPPRTALGHLFVPLAVACGKLGYVDPPDVESTATLLEACAEDWGPSAPSSGNQAKTLAAYLFGRMPVIYGLGDWQGMVANRWKSQFNENAKIMASAQTFPELNHNEIMGWQLADRQNVKHWAVVMLESGDESARLVTRARVTRDVLRGISECFTVTARGETLLEKMLTLTFCGDFVSLYLAALNEVDPETIDAINTLKKTLADLIEPPVRTTH
jgi:glucose/mannose-6-phosphate isomerase